MKVQDTLPTHACTASQKIALAALEGQFGFVFGFVGVGVGVCSGSVLFCSVVLCCVRFGSVWAAFFPNICIQ